MLPTAAGILAGWPFIARRHGYGGVPDERLIDDALQEANALARQRDEDAPAALLFAFARRSGAFPPKASRMMIRSLVRSQAAALGLALDVVDIALDIYCLRVIRNEIEFSQLRDEFAARLRPLAP